MEYSPVYYHNIGQEMCKSVSQLNLVTQIEKLDILRNTDGTIVLFVRIAFI